MLREVRRREPMSSTSYIFTSTLVVKADLLVAHGLPQELRAFDGDRAPRKRNDAIGVDVGIGEIGG